MLKNLFFCFATVLLHAQTYQLEVQDSIRVNYEIYWGQDVLQSSYFSSQNNIYKLTQTDTLIYTSNVAGNLTQVECNSGLQVLLFYKNTNKLVLLDNLFNEIKTIIFTNMLIDFVKPASQNECWFYDEVTQKIGLYNYFSNSFKWISIILTSPPKNAHSTINFFYWVNQNNEWYQLDKFGKITFLGNLEIDSKVVAMNEKELIYIKNNQLYLLQSATKQSYILGNIKKMIKKSFYQNGILSIFTNSLLTNYKLKIQ